MSNSALHKAGVDAKIVQEKKERSFIEVSGGTESIMMAPPDRLSDSSTLADHRPSLKPNGVINKRMYKQIFKFINDNLNITTKTKAIYKGILCDFMRYSPSISPIDLHMFLKSKFPDESIIIDDTLHLKGQTLKYFNVIARFLKFNNQSVNIKTCKQYYTKSTSRFNLVKPKMTKSKVFNLYTSLASMGLIEDAINIHLMFTLWIDPYDLYTLRFDDIEEDNCFQWWDYRVSRFKCCELTNSLKNELKYLKIFLEKKNGVLRKLIRVSLDGIKISGTFILQVTPTAIFNRFNRKFSGKLENCEFTPKDIVESSQWIYSDFKEDSSQRKLYHHDKICY